MPTETTTTSDITQHLNPSLTDDAAVLKALGPFRPVDPPFYTPPTILVDIGGLKPLPTNHEFGNPFFVSEGIAGDTHVVVIPSDRPEMVFATPLAVHRAHQDPVIHVKQAADIDFELPALTEENLTGGSVTIKKILGLFAVAGFLSGKHEFEKQRKQVEGILGAGGLDGIIAFQNKYSVLVENVLISKEGIRMLYSVEGMFVSKMWEQALGMVRKAWFMRLSDKYQGQLIVMFLGMDGKARARLSGISS